jgi:hypothetical protein
VNPVAKNLQHHAQAGPSAGTGVNEARVLLERLIATGSWLEVIRYGDRDFLIWLGSEVGAPLDLAVQVGRHRRTIVRLLNREASR